MRSRCGAFSASVRPNRQTMPVFSPIGEVHAAQDVPAQETVDADVGVDLRPHHPVVGVALRVVGLPAERKAEVPFVVEREPPAEPCDAGALVEVERHGVSQLVGRPEVEVGEPDALVDPAEEPVEARAGAVLPAVAQVSREGEIDGPAAAVGSLHEGVGREDVCGAEFGAQAVHDAACGGVADGEKRALRRGCRECFGCCGWCFGCCRGCCC